MKRAIAIFVTLSALSTPAVAQQAGAPAGLFKAIDDIPTCSVLGISRNLSELARAGNEEAYKRMFDAQRREGKCGMLRKGSTVIVRRAVPPSNLVEMLDVNNGVIYGPGMMLEAVPRKR
jgi:hypothetical protein